MNDIFNDLDSIPKLFKDNYEDNPKKPRMLDKNVIMDIHKIIAFFGLENYAKLSKQQVVNLFRATWG